MAEPIDLDDTLENADWLRQTWTLPPYKSPEFMRAIEPQTIEQFQQLPLYKNAVEQGLIFDDEWVANTVDTKPRDTSMEDLINSFNEALARAQGKL